MYNSELAKHWRGLDEAARVDWLKRLHSLNLSLTAEELNIEPEELDAVAHKAGLVGIRKTVVDAAGMRDWECGVVAPEFAKYYRPRAMRIGNNSV